MAADATLSVAVVAEVEGFKSGFNQVGVSIGDLQRKILAYKDIVANALDPNIIAKYNAKIEVTAMEVKRLNQLGKGGFDSLAKGSNQAGMALTDLGRIAQDIPYGFQGIQNNLNPMLESFQRLKTETGSTGGALKALGSSLMGPAGLGIALSVISAGVLLYQEYQRKANKEVENAKKTTDEYAKSLNQVAQAQLVGEQNAQKELITLELLFSTYQNGNLPLKQRKEAYEQIQDIYPDYFKNIKFEAEASDQTTSAYERLRDAIIATAKARAAEDLLVQNSKKQLENEQKLADLEAKRLKTQTELKKAGSIIGGSVNTLTGTTGNTGPEYQRLKLEGEINTILSAQQKLKDENKKIDTDNLQLVKSINTEVEKGAKISGSVGKSNEGSKAKKLPALKEGLPNAVGAGNPFKDVFKIGDKALITAEQVEKAVDKINNSSQELDLSPWERELVEFNEKASAILNDGIIATLAGLGESMGSALASGSSALEAMGASLLSSLGGVLIELGKLAIQTGIGIQAIKTAIKTLNPAVAVAAGVALVALGTYVQGRASKIGGGNDSGSSDAPKSRNIPGFAKGVTNFSGGLAIVGEQGPELVNLPSGSDVIPNNKISSMMGKSDQPIQLVASLEMKLDKLFVGLKRVEKLNGRMN